MSTEHYVVRVAITKVTREAPNKPTGTSYSQSRQQMDAVASQLPERIKTEILDLAMTEPSLEEGISKAIRVLEIQLAPGFTVRNRSLQETLRLGGTEQ